jgi:Sulfatase
VRPVPICLQKGRPLLYVVRTLPEPPSGCLFQPSPMTMHSNQRPTRWVRPFAVCISWATLMLLSAISIWTDNTNRFFYFWQRSDALAVIAAILVLAACAFLLYRSAQAVHNETLLRCGAIAFILTLVDGVLGYVLADIKAQHDVRDALIWAACSAVAVGVTLATRWRLARAAVNACLFMLPLTVILSLQMLSWPSWDTRSGQLERRNTAGETPTRPVFLFIFDEWSQERSAPSGQYLSFFRNVRQLASQATLYTHALSDGMDTDVSLPRILYSQLGHLLADGNQLLWRTGESNEPVNDVPNIFELGRSRGYTTAMLGYYLPYRALLGDQVDFVATYPHVAKSDSWAGKVAETLLGSEVFLPDPVNRWIGRRLNEQLLSRHWIRLNHRVRAHFRSVLIQAGARGFVVVHFPLPHGPFVYNADGSFRGPFRGRPTDGTPADYERSLRYLDVVIGDLTNEIRLAGLFDSALVVLTSDHSWRVDPDTARMNQPDAYRRVPLLVKWPGQKAPKVIDTPFCLGGLRSLVSRAVGEAPDAPPACTTGWKVLPEQR